MRLKLQGNSDMLEFRTGISRQNATPAPGILAANWLALAVVLACSSAASLPAAAPTVADTPEYQRLCKAMSLTIPASDQPDTPLIEAVEMLRGMTQLDILIDRRALADAAIPLDVKVDVEFHGRTLANELAILLTPHDLAWMWRDGVIYITTVDALEEHLILRVYPVGDLMQPSSGESDKSPFEPLMAVIEESIEPDSWLHSGGSATLVGLESAGALVCRHTWQAHQELETLLKQLRDTRSLQQGDE